MKNIHVLPTDKQSRLYKNINNELSFTDVEFEQKINGFNINQNIYITSDSDLDINDWVTDGKDIWQVSYILADNIQQAKKIILTTDQDLIKDGVQPIDDEFLEWFVKNSSCESVEVYYDLFEFQKNSTQKKYIIIIPKEEPNYNMKQEILAEMERLEEEPKQETLEDAAKKLFGCLKKVGSSIYHINLSQDENKYSDEDMKSFGDWCRNGLLNTEYGVEKLDKHLEQWKQLTNK